MPNQGNKSNGKSGVVQPKKNTTMPKKKQGDDSNTAKKGNEGNGAKEKQ